ncbi:MAG: UvrB/UvrC motif-containing protein [Candidatus Omnitrophota bacterium]|nr:UvrB/UvrC motif-containing protein [Candidatus Omnitrophota bacterium]MDZ4241539.1 UvrB/UvrC motif-containing protein [Candidatus Omnitrophota bacterium]
MLCDICSKKKATVHLTEIVDDQMTEMHLCEECAREKSVQMEQQFGLADLLAGLADFGKQVKEFEKVKLECPACGMSYEDFRKFGRLGCGNCYPAFKQHLSSLLKKIHGSGRHVGKSPTKLIQAQAGKKAVDTLQDLRHQLQRAIESEDFEKAAELRDKIRQAESREQA